MKLDATLLVVKNMDRARHFYEEVLFRKVTLNLGVYTVFEDGLCLLTEDQWTTFLGGEAPAYAYKNNVCQLGFEEDDFDSFIKHLQAFPEVEILTEATEYAWGQRAVRFYDPDKHIIEVGESMKVVVKRFLQAGLSIEETIEKSMFPRDFVEMCKEEIAT